MEKPIIKAVDDEEEPLKKIGQVSGFDGSAEIACTNAALSE
jgi:hypothetical protein